MGTKKQRDMNMLTKETQMNISLLLLRSGLGVVMFAHGAQKLFGWFNGFGFDGTMNYFTQTIGLPSFISLLIILGESLGAIALILGFFGRFMASAIFIIMFGALIIDHAPNG